MAAPTATAVFLDENLHIHRGPAGKRADGLKAKPLKPLAAKQGLQEKKALRDVSNIGKPPVSTRKPLQDVSNTAKPRGRNISDGTTLKKTALRSHEATKNPVKKTVIFSDETAKCHEWAKDGVEGTHFTGNDSQKLEKDSQDKRVKKKVEKIMSALHDWPDAVFDHVLFPSEVVAAFFEEVKEMELEPEILPENNRRRSSSGDKMKLAEDPFTEDELDYYPFLENNPVEFQLRDELPLLEPGMN
ncbi:uncharacterized LOC4329928 [Oryza sativa Japonica Group]|jgi:hypothetical protein|uniref:Os02g0606700 protein n=3 Tax=Oryza TaxID=4527 RepID=Q0DZP4_ORYSJ|nr:uncharacterized LOC4329928 [Oryza sativa Japonica Group]NP_001411514.1 uncharacterized LOC4329928 [Oryza sativa Japonica Group]XP_052142611.1 uncharacterized protein LOC127762224 [Oryza glaberrima]XP_052142613.1 uncharacterized protein LOC127762224 [Oryza glaberrima]KAB8087862.1 hypothetical protein EE612_012297 [Oryza sativa]KAF2945752.1 hypothetical protein DAI22_02g240200 [Oryza sativa Japonica Group]KAF2945753.1 hypothetical protein DAI22_02g240200 [Oryza sativa Japonica Group]BAD2013|eukprot:NP_001047380.1 Os02g0606700 [Oryza sativa Japonica Group]